MGEQDLDHRPGARPLAEPGPELGPQQVIGEREVAAHAGLVQRQGSREGAGPLDEQLEVVVELQALSVLEVQARMGGDKRAAVEDLDGHGADPDVHDAADQRHRDGVEVRAHPDPGLGVHPGIGQLRELEALGGQRDEERPLEGHGLAHCHRPALERAVEVTDRAGQQVLVRLLPGADLRHGYEPPAAEAAALPFHAAFLVSTLLAGRRVRGLEPVVRPEGDEAILLLAPGTPQDLGHGLGEAVEPQNPEPTAQVAQAALDPVEEGGLGRGRVGDVEVGGRELRSDHDDLGRLPSPREVEVGLVEVRLALGAYGMVLGTNACMPTPSSRRRRACLGAGVEELGFAHARAYDHVLGASGALAKLADALSLRSARS